MADEEFDPLGDLELILLVVHNQVLNDGVGGLLRHRHGHCLVHARTLR